MNSITSKVNVFQGSGKIDLPKPEGIAAAWWVVKARCGNTHPGAAYPFGRMTVSAYTGGYPTGYGNHRPNTCGDPSLFEAHVRGFSHLHHSGTGGINTYYNYALTSFSPDGLSPMCEDYKSERAEPGYYRAELNSGLVFEGTVTDRVALHRYTSDKAGYLQIDFSACGLDRSFGERYYATPAVGRVKKGENGRVSAYCRFKGVDLYFAAECKGSEPLLWEDYTEVEGSSLEYNGEDKRFGAAFPVPAGVSSLRLAISFISEKNALAMLEGDERGFDDVRSDTLAEWEEKLGRIRIDTSDEDLFEIFYSNLYHTLIKPCDASGEAFLYGDNPEGDFVFDLATLWDMYKTQLPLVYTCYPEIGGKVLETLIKLIEKNGRSPINITLAENNDFPNQARMLAEHSFADAYFRGRRDLGARMLAATERDLATHTDFLGSGYCERYTHILDLSDALGAMAELAAAEGRAELAEKLAKLSENWINAYDKETGLMSLDSDYYEGNNYTYSFRPQRNMRERIELMGKERFTACLDGFFGYGAEPLCQSTEPENNPILAGYNRFEGYNNECDMETPLAYHYVGRHDRLAEITRAGCKYMFTKGRGGLPGNNDSGGLSSEYIWLALGIHPVSGQDLMIITSPLVREAELKLAGGRTLVIRTVGEGIYPISASLDGKALPDLSFTASDMMKGGELVIGMSEENPRL